MPAPHGMDLGFVNYSTDERPMIDCFRMAGPPGAKGGPVDAVTSMPTGSSAVEVVRMIPIDPGTRDWVLLCDANVKQVRFALTGSPTVKPVGGRAQFTLAAGDLDNIQIKITATGPVSRMAIVRADHEAAYLAGEIFNPDFLAAIKPFPFLRPLDWAEANAKAYPAQRPLPTDGYFARERGGMPAELIAQVAARNGSKLRQPINLTMPDAQKVEFLRALDANAGSSAIDLEPGNEVWNDKFPIHAVAVNATVARYGAKGDLRRYYGWIAGNLAMMAAKISARFKVDLCWQVSKDGAHLKAILAGWDESGAPRSLIAGYSEGPYVNGQRDGMAPLMALYQANDVEGFYALADAKRAERAAWFQGVADACAAEGIPFKLYEHNFSLVANAPAIPDAATEAAFLAWAMPLIHSDRMAAIIMRNVEDAVAAGAVECCFFQLAGPGSGSGVWGSMPHVSLPPYPIYQRLVAANAAASAPVDPLPTLAEIRADLAAVTGKIDRLIG